MNQRRPASLYFSNMSTPPQRNLVLIVDDVPMNVQVLGEALSRDYRIRVATRGEDALAIAAGADKPDLILLDVMMPGMDGYEVCRRLRAEAATKNIPVIFVTAKGEVEDEEKGLDLGAVDYIAKPFHIPIVRARVRNHMSLKLKADLLEAMAMLDGLTHIPNRRRLDETLEMEWRRASRGGGCISFVIADIDFFKRYNDHYGHGTGDECLKAAAAAMARVVARPGDLLARYGGEEFAAVLPDTDLEGAQHLAEALRSAVAALSIRHEYSGAADRVTISVGYSTAMRFDGLGVADLMASADRMLYQAKERGRNRVCGQECIAEKGR